MHFSYICMDPQSRAENVLSELETDLDFCVRGKQVENKNERHRSVVCIFRSSLLLNIK